MNYTIVKDRGQFIVTINEIADAKFIKELIDYLEGNSEESKLSSTEVEALLYCHQGESCKEIADKLCDKFIKKQD